MDIRKNGYNDYIRSKTAKMMKRIIVITLLLMSAFFTAHDVRNSNLAQRIEVILKDIDCVAGISVMYDGEEIYGHNSDVLFPMLSVFKLHQAIAVLDSLGKAGRSIEDTLVIKRSEIREDTYSPMRSLFAEGDVRLPIYSILEYSLLQSDNNACDILFDRFGGTEYVREYIHNLSFTHTAIKWNENDMHEDIMRCYDNNTTPGEATRLLEMVYTRRIPEGHYSDWLVSALENCDTGRDRLPAPLTGTKALIGHKTGTGDRNMRGEIIGVNDVGFIVLPDGRHYSIAIFLKDIKGDLKEAESCIARISKVVFESLTLRCHRNSGQ